MAAGRYDFTIEKGVDFERTLTYLIGTTAPLSPFDFSGYIAALQVRNAPGGTLYLDMNTSNGRLQLGGALGTVLLLLDASVTNTLSWEGRAYYDLVLDNGVDQFRLVEGRVSLSPQITVFASTVRGFTVSALVSGAFGMGRTQIKGKPQARAPQRNSRTAGGSVTR